MENISKDNKTKKEDKHLLDSESKLSQEPKSMRFTYKSLNTELEELGACRQTNLFHMMAAPKNRLKRNEGGLETGRPLQGPLTHFFCKSCDLQKAEQQREGGYNNVRGPWSDLPSSATQFFVSHVIYKELSSSACSSYKHHRKQEGKRPLSSVYGKQ